MSDVLLFFVILAVGVGVAYLAYQQAKKRREALAHLARELGWTFDPSRDYGHDDEYAQFGIFRRGRRRVAFNTLSGSLDIAGRRYSAKMGDFSYTVKRGKSSTTYTFSYLILHLPFMRVPDLLIRREGLFDKLAGAIGFDDIDFESAEFSDRFLVKSSDKRFAYDVVHARTMAFLLDGNPPAVDIERGSCCIADDTKRRWQPADFRQRLAWATRFFELWPDHLVAQLER